MIVGRRRRVEKADGDLHAIRFAGRGADGDVVQAQIEGEREVIAPGQHGADESRGERGHAGIGQTGHQLRIPAAWF